MSDVAHRFAENLAYYQEQADLTQEALATRAQVHRTEVGDLLRAKKVPRLDTVVKLAGALGVPPAKLVEYMSFEPAALVGKFKFPPPKRKK